LQFREVAREILRPSTSDFAGVAAHGGCRSHLIWQFERAGNQVHYISVSVNDQTYPVDLYKSYEPNSTMEDIGVAFQMDGDYAQQPYNVWLDKVTLTAQ
jgi:hypothetical protein